MPCGNGCSPKNKPTTGEPYPLRSKPYTLYLKAEQTGSLPTRVKHQSFGVLAILRRCQKRNFRIGRRPRALTANHGKTTRSAIGDLCTAQPRHTQNRRSHSHTAHHLRRTRYAIRMPHRFESGLFRTDRTTFGI